MGEYNFSWDMLGDMQLGRPNLGLATTVEIYRLMQYTMKAVLEKDFGSEITNEIFVKAGKLAGTEYCKHFLDVSLPMNSFIAQLNQLFVEQGIGVFRVEKLDSLNLDLVVTLSEDLDCSGLPVSDNTVCDYDEGFFSGIFCQYTGKEFDVKEIDCWATGDRTCRFTIRQKK